MSWRGRLEAVWRNRHAPAIMLQQSHLTCSQYGEDLAFMRLLHPSTTGTYVDVGAHHPVRGSNTFRLYAHGWRGVTIDPNPRFATIFRQLRPRDTHLVEGVARTPGELTYHQFDHDVLNTLSDERAEELRRGGTSPRAKTVVPCRPLSDIVDQHLAGQSIDLLSVDCEGLDLDVLASLDLNRRRPTTIIIEDYRMFGAFQADVAEGDLKRFLREQGYSPIAQCGWSTLLIANDWRRLFKRSAAFDEARTQNGYLPGQAFPAGRFTFPAPREC